MFIVRGAGLVSSDFFVVDLVNPIINLLFGGGLYHPFMVILGLPRYYHLWVAGSSESSITPLASTRRSDQSIFEDRR